MSEPREVSDAVQAANGDARPEAAAPARREAPSRPARPQAPPVTATRAGRAWVAIILGIVLLAVLLVFIFQNLHETTIHFFTVTGSLPVALALLFAAIAGAVVVLLVGSVRIVQLRRHVRSSFAEGARRSGVGDPGESDAGS